MKKNILILAAIFTFIGACEKLEDPLKGVHDEYEAQKDPINESIEYTLTEDDYAAVAKMARAAATTKEDSANANRVANYLTFSADITANKYVPYLLSDMYLALGAGSSAMVTYNVNSELPEDLTEYTNAAKYELQDADYTSIDGVVDMTKYYSPSYSPDLLVANALPTDGYSDGDLLLATYKYSDVDAIIDYSSVGVSTIFEENFETDLGSFTAISVVGDQVWGASSYGGATFAKMSGYAGGAHANEDWLITPGFDMDANEGEMFSFTSAMNYGSEGDGSMTVMVSSDYDGSSAPSTATWTEIDPVLSTGGFSWAESGDLDFSGYTGTLYVAFKYVSTDAAAATWEFTEIKMQVPSGATVVGGDPMKYSTYYQMDGNKWKKANNIYYINDVDYDAMGEGPGNYNNFDYSNKPNDYIPALLNAKFPVAGEGKEIVVVYKYYDSGAKTLADRYTMTNGQWMSYYSYIMPKTDQFINNGENWVFDPTVTMTMGASDYQIIVDYVKAGEHADLVDSYGTGEFYYGANSYYGNFDLRPSKRGGQPEFDGLTIEEATALVDQRLAEGLIIMLKKKFPEATAQVEGVDVYYVVKYAYYDGSNGTGSKKFQCTKSGPDPEFVHVAE